MAVPGREPQPIAADTVARLTAESRRWPLLSAAQEVELAERIARGDRAARERMILSNVRLVISVANGYRHRGVPQGDLVQEGMLGLLRAVDRFDPRRRIRFSTYATILIRKFVHAAVERDSRAVRVPREVAEDGRALAAAERSLTARLGRTPTAAEIAAASGLSDAALQRTRAAEQAPVPIDRRLGDEDAGTLGDLIADPAPSPEARATAGWTARALSTAVASLPGTERAVIELRFDPEPDGRPRSFEEIGRTVGLSSERVRQLERQALRRLSFRRELAALRPAG